MTVYIGYIASICLAISILAKNNIKSRWYNLAGTIFFIVYGLMVKAIPVLVANGGLFFINIYQLYKLYSYKEQFKLIEITGDNAIANNFLKYYEADIALFFPNFSRTNTKNQLSFVVLRNMELANIFIATVNDKGQAFVELNYTIPKFRDYKVGRFIFNTKNTVLTQKSIHEIVYKPPIENSHQQFLLKMGFEAKTIEGEICYIKNIS